MTTNLTINQEVYIMHSRFAAHARYTKGRVIKVTPSGQVSVLTARSSEPYRFTQYGKEIGSDSYSSAYLETDVEAVEKHIAYEAARQNTNKVVNDIKQVLENHRAGDGGYNITSETKAELLKLVESL